MVEFLCDQIETTMGHCDLFKRQKILTSLRLLSFARGYGELHILFIIQRSDWIMVKISATCTVGAMEIKL